MKSIISASACVALLSLIPLQFGVSEARSVKPGPIVVEMHQVDTQGVGKSIGTLTFADSKDGLTVTPKLSELPAGEHGFHIHENPDCAPKEKDGKMAAAGAAGGHFDPHKTGKHAGPDGGGHEGDLPKLVVDAHGNVTKVMTIKGVTVEDVTNHSVMIHAGGDNYSDSPEPLGGGGARIACGVIH